jgi:hypothetical protein
LEEDPETGSREFRYRKLGEDHYRHALNYLYLASQRIRIAEGFRRHRDRELKSETEFNVFEKDYGIKTSWFD